MSDEQEVYCDNVIDLMAVRIERLCNNARSDEELEMAECLYEMYESGDVIVTMEAGELFFQWVGGEPPLMIQEDHRH